MNFVLRHVRPLWRSQRSRCDFRVLSPVKRPFSGVMSEQLFLTRPRATYRKSQNQHMWSDIRNQQIKYPVCSFANSRFSFRVYKVICSIRALHWKRSGH